MLKIRKLGTGAYGMWKTSRVKRGSFFVAIFKCCIANHEYRLIKITNSMNCSRLNWRNNYVNLFFLSVIYKVHYTKQLLIVLIEIQLAGIKMITDVSMLLFSVAVKSVCFFFFFFTWNLDKKFSWPAVVMFFETIWLGIYCRLGY